MKKLLTKITGILLLAMPMLSNALVFSGSNFKDNEYPRMENAPLEPTYEDSDSVNEHKKKIRDYLRKTEAYVENADSDIKRIQAERSDAIHRAEIEAKKYNLETDLPNP